MNKLRLRKGLWALALLCAGACAPATDEEAPAASQPIATATPDASGALDVATELELRNARMPMPGLITSGQPTEEQFEALAAAGVSNFISLRPTTEDGAGWEESHAMPEGVGFTRLPISGAASLTRENVELFAAILEDAGDDATSLYCASSNRVGALLALKAYWIDGATPEEALSIGEDAGLSSLGAPVRELMGLEPEG